MKKIYIAAFAIIVGVVTLMFGYMTSNVPKASADLLASIAYVPLNQSAVLCTMGTSTLLVASSTGRQFIQLTNFGKTQNSAVYLGIGVPAATSTGLLLSASSTLSFSKNNILYLGAIYCMTDTNAGTAATTTAVQFP